MIIPRIVLLSLLMLASRVHGAVFVVDQYGGGTHTSIQAAINDAYDGDEIIVNEGRYREGIDFLGKAVTIRSRDPYDDAVVAATVIDGDALGHVVTFASGEPRTARLMGVTVFGGFAELGGGVFCVGATRPTLRRNVLVENFAALHGGGVYCADGAAPLLVDNEIRSNRCIGRGAGVYVADAAPVVRDNVIEFNVAACSSGGGVQVAPGGSGAVIVGNLIAHNSAIFGGGMQVDGSAPWVVGNHFLSNAAVPRGGAFSCANGAPRFYSNVLEGNQAAYGAAIEYNRGGGSLRGNTIVSNRVETAAVCLFLNSSRVELLGNIVAFHDAGIAVQALTGSTITGSHNCLFANAGGDTSGTVTLEETMSDDPLLAAVGFWEQVVGDEVPLCRQSHMRATLTGRVGSGEARFEVADYGSKFRVDVRDIPPGSYPVQLAGKRVGTLQTDERGRGRLEYSDEDGDFPPDFPHVRDGDVVEVGSVLAGAFVREVLAAFPERYRPGDAHLSVGSPCRDAYAAGEDWPPPGDRDVDGQPRVAGEGMDIGADEFIAAGTGDADGDDDVDLADYGVFQDCFGVAPLSPACAPHDLYDDGRIDLADLRLFLALLTGPG
jgi:hypothetical protein